VYVAALSGGNLAFNNIERVEVLKGPQGTLFGRNATGGLLHVITRDPQFDAVLRTQASVASYETVGVNLYGSTGLSETVAADLAFFSTDQGEGWGRNVSGVAGVNGQDVNFRDEWGVRGALLWNASNALTFRLSADYVERVSDIGNTRVLVPGAWGINGLQYSGDPHDTESNLPPDVNFEAYGVHLRAEYEINPNLTLHSTTAFRSVDNFTYFDQDATSAAVVNASLGENTESFQQEFLLNGDAGALAYTLGYFYFQSTARFDPFGIRGAQNFDQWGEMDTTSNAVFAQGTYALTDQTSVTLGVRYTEDERSIEGERTAAGDPSTVLISSDTNTFPNEQTFDQVTWRAAVDHEFNEDVLVYASASRGFKSGIYNLTNPFAPPADPEVLDAYEVGIKSDWFRNTLRFNLAAYHYDYADIQLSRIVAGSTIIYNAAEAEVNGVDIDLIYAPRLPFGDLELRASGSFLDTEYTDFPDAFVYVPRGDGPDANTTPDGGNLVVVQDVTGNELRMTPPFSGTFSAQYSWPVSNDLEVRLTGSYYYNDGFFWDPGNTEAVAQDAYSVVSARITLARQDDRWAFSLFGNNLGDELYLTQMSASSLGDQGSYAAPLTVGASISYNFGAY
jgi:iron complex outermembrane recepter protein